MGNGASCGENARDVGADEELNPMLMGDADKENNYRRPSVPHVQAVRSVSPHHCAFFCAPGALPKTLTCLPRRSASSASPPSSARPCARTTRRPWPSTSRF